MKSPSNELPRRLSEGEGPAAELLQRFTRQPPHAPGENAAWDDTLARLGREAGGHRGRLIVALVLGAVTGAAALYVALVPHSRPATLASGTNAPPAAPRPPAQAVTAAALPVPPHLAPAAGPDAPHIRLGRAAVGLPVGPAELVDEANVTLSRDGSARAFTTPAAATVELGTGAVDLHVEKRRAEAGHAFQVQAGPYRFTVLGTVFRVARTTSDVTLSVTEGRVAVSRGDTALAIITAGGFWSGDARDRRAPLAPAAPAITAAALPALAPRPTGGPSPAPDACAARAKGGDAAGAVSCFLAVAKGSDLGAEVALYQAARLYRDALDRPEQAVATLGEARRRFPTGALSREVNLSLAELLPKVGRYRETLAVTQSVLDGQPGEARAAELHLLRGDVLRAGLASCPAAEPEYAAAARAADERVADAAAFWRAACLEQQGLRPEARAAFALYLTRPRPARAAEARRHLQALEGRLTGRP